MWPWVWVGQWASAKFYGSCPRKQFNPYFNYDDESVINKINIYFINDTQKNVKFIFKNKNMYKKGDDFINNQGSIIHFESTYLNKNYSICSIHQYKQ